MLAEENIFKLVQPSIELSKDKTVLLVEECMIEAVAHFKTYLKLRFHQKKKLNENDLTQEYTKQVQILIRKKDYPFNIEGQYQDIYHQSKGFSDFFFYPNEQNVSTASFFS